MKYRSVFILTVFLFTLSIHNKVQSQELTWAFTRSTRDSLGHEKIEPITYFISSEVTKIEYTNEVIYIDYAKHILYRYNKADEVCLKFPLLSDNASESSDTKKISKKKYISLISSLKVITTTEHKEVARYNCSLKHIMFGADLAMFQMVAPLVVHEFSQDFKESMVGYYVSNDIIELNTLFSVAQQRSDVFKNNPLLRQIDIVGLFEILNGFPVQTIQKLRNSDSVTTLLENPKQNEGKRPILIPEKCRE